jgi:hypothetical protein
MVKIVFEDEKEIHGLTTSGRIFKIDACDKWLFEVFPTFASTKEHVTCTRTITTEFGYATQRAYLHKIVTKTWMHGCPMIDHINRDGHDNRRSNLRFANSTQNVANSKPKKNKSIPYKGVVLRNNHQTKKFGSFFNYGKKKNNLGYFKTAKKAAMIYDVNSLAHHGDFAYLNFPEKKDLYFLIIKTYGIDNDSALVKTRSGYKSAPSTAKRYELRDM